MDPDGDAFSVSVTLADAMPFTTYSDIAFTFNPVTSNIKMTPYSISIILTDHNPSPKKMSYSFVVWVDSTLA